MHERFIFCRFATLYPYFYSFIRPFMAYTFSSPFITDLRSMLDVFETKTIDRNGHEVSNRNKNTCTKKKQRLDHSDQNKPRRDNSYIFFISSSFVSVAVFLYFIHLMSFTSIPTIINLKYFLPFGSLMLQIEKLFFF